MNTVVGWELAFGSVVYGRKNSQTEIVSGIAATYNFLFFCSKINKKSILFYAFCVIYIDVTHKHLSFFF
jgi:hypothetical protein